MNLRIFLIAFLLGAPALAQTFTRQDSLRGSITPERVWWDLTHYHLDIAVNPDRKHIAGTNTIRYTVLKPHKRLQIDLQPPLQIEKVTQDGRELPIEHDGNAHFLQLKKRQKKGRSYEIVVHYSGHPPVAKRAPWDGGITWSEDANGKAFVGSSCQGLGASVWWPTKDHMYDEPDSMAISLRVPKDLVGVSNGRLRDVETHPNGEKTYHWAVQNPINNYGVSINVGDYVHFGETYTGEDGALDMDYWVLRDHLEKARVHFVDAPRTIEALEYWFGPYPFYEDSYKLVEAPFLGMEHQSNVAYGNRYLKGYLGSDMSGSGWGMTFDFIIVHESGHEWFANSVTYRDIADMWVHESFTAYSESLFVEYFHGKEAGADYVVGTQNLIKNDRPVVGQYDVNHRGSGDMYYKGANMLHSLRQWVGDDEKWRHILRGLQADFRHQTVSGQEIEAYLAKKTGLDLKPFFDQYLRQTQLPKLQFRLSDRELSFRYTDTVLGFALPVQLYVNENLIWIHPTTEWKSQTLNAPLEFLEISPDFLVEGELVE